LDRHADESFLVSNNTQRLIELRKLLNDAAHAYYVLDAPDRKSVV